LKILFVNPNHNWNTEAKAYGARSYLRVRKITAPMGLGYLAAMVRNEHTVKLIDANVADLSFESVVDEAKKFSPDIAAVSAMFPSTEHVIRLGRSLRPYVGVLMAGGADPTVRAEEYLQSFDIVNKGQGEISFKKFIDGTPKDGIQGFAFKKNGSIVDNGVGAMVENLDDLPFMPWDLFPLRHRYRPAVMQIKYSFPSAGMLTSRGCPNHCAYCAIHTVVPKFKDRSVKNTLEEIASSIKTYGFTHFEFFDDTFTFEQERVIEFCEAIIRSEYDIRWSCITRPDCVDAGMLRLMRRAGCYFILYGVQSVDETVLKNVNRPLFGEQVKIAARMTKEAGIMVRFDFILGLPGSSDDNMRESFLFVKETRPDVVDFYPVLWLPGTELVQKYRPQYDDAYLEKLATSFYKQFYLRPSYLFQVLKHCTKPVFAFRFFLCFYALFGGFISKKLARIRGKK
jgi:anaerobic magnesium-protoporphyrin IX monomethyl ester cyclase